MVNPVIMHRHDLITRGRENGRAEREEPLCRFRGDQGAPVQHGSGAPSPVNRGEVDREALPEKVGPLTCREW